MRRKENEIKDKELIEDILRKADVLRIAMCEGDTPYIVPMSFGYRDSCIYLHSAREGKKLDILKKSNKVCFEAEHGVELEPSDNACNWSVKYYSVIGLGKAYLIDDMKGKIEALDIIMSKYSDDTNFNYSEKELNRVIIIKVEISEVTGKKSS